MSVSAKKVVARLSILFTVFVSIAFKTNESFARAIRMQCEGPVVTKQRMGLFPPSSTIARLALSSSPQSRLIGTLEFSTDDRARVWKQNQIEGQPQDLSVKGTGSGRDTYDVRTWELNLLTDGVTVKGKEMMVVELNFATSLATGSGTLLCDVQ